MDLTGLLAVSFGALPVLRPPWTIPNYGQRHEFERDALTLSVHIG